MKLALRTVKYNLSDEVSKNDGGTSFLIALLRTHAKWETVRLAFRTNETRRHVEKKNIR